MHPPSGACLHLVQQQVGNLVVALCGRFECRVHGVIVAELGRQTSLLMIIAAARSDVWYMCARALQQTMYVKWILSLCEPLATW